MKEKLEQPGCPSPGRQRSAEEIRRDIHSERSTITHTVETLGNKLQCAMDWREYVRKYPFIATGAAAGLGAAIPLLFSRRKNPMERIVEAAEHSSRRINNRSLLVMGITTMLAKALSVWARGTAAGIIKGEGQEGPAAGRRYTDTMH